MKVITLLWSLVFVIVLSACGGGGGSNTPSTPIVTPVSISSSSASSKAAPIPVEKTSYLNRIKFGDPLHKKEFAIEGRRVLAWSDFLRDGSSIMLAVNLITGQEKLAGKDWKSADIAFYKMEPLVGGAGAMRGKNITSTLISDTTGCITLKKANIADFNNDGRPDAYLGCHGADTADSVGEHQRILLSQPDGTYKNIEVPLICYCHASAAGDINGDGNIDIVTYDNLTIANSDGVGFKHYPHPIALLGNGDGTFKQDITIFNKVMEWKPIFTLDLIDYGRGFLDLFVGGSGASTGVCAEHCFENSIVHNDGMGRFTDAPKAIDNSRGATGIFYHGAVDFVVKGGYLYMNQIDNNYDYTAVRKVDLRDLTRSTILVEFEDTTTFHGPWFPWMVILDDGNIAAVCDMYMWGGKSCNWTGI